MNKVLALPIQEDSLYKEGAYLKNITQVPSESGNAKIQLASIPKLSKMPDRIFCNRGYIEDIANPIITGHKAFDRIIAFEKTFKELKEPSGATVLYPQIKTNLYSKDGGIIKEDVIPVWENLNSAGTNIGYAPEELPQCEEFIGTFGFYKQIKSEVSRIKQNNLSFSNVYTNTSLPPGQWLSSYLDYDQVPQYQPYNSAYYKVNITRNVSVKCSCWCNYIDPNIQPPPAFDNNGNPIIIRPDGYYSWFINTFTYTFNVEIIKYNDVLVQDDEARKWLILKRGGEIYAVDSENLSRVYPMFRLQISRLKRTWNTTTNKFDEEWGPYTGNYIIQFFGELETFDFSEPYIVGLDELGQPCLIDFDLNKKFFRFIGDEYDLPFLTDVIPADSLELAISFSNGSLTSEQARKAATRIKWLMEARDPNMAKAIVDDVSTTGYCRLQIPGNLYAKWIEQLAARLLVVSNNDVFWYSNAGTLIFDALSYYHAEYLNSKPLEIHRIGNRFALMTDNTIELWDTTINFENPFSAKQTTRFYSMTAMPNSVVFYNDVLFFIAKPFELPQYQLYALDVSGELKRMSYPQLDNELNKIIQELPTFRPRIFSEETQNYPLYWFMSSIIQWNNQIFIQWNLNGTVVCLNTAYNTFFLMDESLFFVQKLYFKYNSTETGFMSNYANNSVLRVRNTNFEGKNRSVKTYAIDWDTGGWVKDIWVKIIRVSGWAGTALRQLVINPLAGNRNLISKLNLLGTGQDFQTEINFMGEARLNNITMEIQ